MCANICSMASTPYVELHAHTAFSFLDGASAPEEMAGAAAEMGHAALAITDHDGLCGSLAFAHAARAVGVRPITGAELTLRDGSHLTLLAADATGYANLCRLITIAHADTRPPPDRRPLPPALDRCRAGRPRRGAGVPHRLRPPRPGAAPGGGGRAAGAPRRPCASLVRDFGPGNVQVEIQRPRTRGDRRLARDLVRPGRGRRGALRGHRRPPRPHAPSGPCCRTPSWPSATA